MGAWPREEFMANEHDDDQSPTVEQRNEFETEDFAVTDDEVGDDEESVDHDDEDDDDEIIGK